MFLDLKLSLGVERERRGLDRFGVKELLFTYRKSFKIIISKTRRGEGK